MKIRSHCRRLAGLAHGFTLTEMMMASALFILLTCAIVYSFLLGLHLHRTAQVKLGGNDDARKALVSVTDEIRGAARIQVGSGNASNFVAVATNAAQVGSALQIYPSSDTNSWIRYFSDSDSGSTNYTRLCRTTSADSGRYTLVVRHALINTTNLFSSEDSYGNVLSNDQNNRVIGVNLQFYQVEYPVLLVGSQPSHDFYQLRTRITRRRLY